MLDTVGREITVKREVQIDEMGWPVHDGAMSVGAGQQVGFVAVGVSWACLTVPPQAARVMNVTKEGGLCTAREPHEHLRCPEGGGCTTHHLCLMQPSVGLLHPCFTQARAGTGGLACVPVLV